MNKTEKIFLYSVAMLSVSIMLTVSSISSARQIVNTVSNNKVTAIAVGEGSQAVAGGISISGKKIITEQGSKDIERTETRKFDNCNALKIEDFFGTVFVRFGETNSAKISAGSSVVSAITTVVRGEVLVVSLEKNIITNIPMVIDLEMKHTESLVVNGVADVFVENVKSDKFKVEINGSASVVANGTVNELDAAIRGNGDLKFGQLLSQKCTVVLNGTGDVEVNVVDSLIAKINGSGDIFYHGNPPEISRSVNGVGDILPVVK